MYSFVPKGSTTFYDTKYYLDFVLKLVLATGIAFVLPVFLVLLNFVGILRGAHDPEGLALGDPRDHDLHRDRHPGRRRHLDDPAGDPDDRALLRRGRRRALARPRCARSARRSRPSWHEAASTQTLSPAERYAAAQARRAGAVAAPRLEEFRERIEFPLDDFQLAACEALEAGRQRAGRRTDRCRQDDRRRVRRAPRARTAARQGVLHDADEGAEQPEVRGARRRARSREGRPAHRRQQRQQRRTRRRDDDRGAAQHALRRLAAAQRSRVRRHGRGALPGRPLPRRRVGRGHHPPAADGAAGVAQRHGVERRGVRRLAAGGARRHRRHRVGGAPGARSNSTSWCARSCSSCSTPRSGSTSSAPPPTG